MTTPAPAARPARASRVLLPALSFVVMVVAVLQTLVVPVLADIGAQLGAGTAAVGWVVTANLLAAAVMTPVLGRLGDVHGKRPVLVGVLVVVAAGALLAAATSSLPLLIAGRVLQGASFALFPLGMAVLRDELPAEKLTSGMAVVSGTLGVGGGFGLVLTGLLTDGGADYHRIFWLALGVVLAALVLTLVVVPRRPGAGGRVDWLGGLVLGASLVLLLLPLSQGHTWGWASPRTVGAFVAAAVLFAGWVRLEGRVAAPLVTRRVLTHRPVVVTNLAALCIGMALFVSFLGVSTLVQVPRAVAGYGFTASVLQASVVYLLPGALVGVVVAPLAGRMVRRVGGRLTLLLASVLGAVGYVALAVAHSTTALVIGGAVVVNVGVTVAYAALPALLVAEVEPAETGVANSVNSIARSVGSSVASAVVVTLLAGGVLPSTGLPAESVFTLAFTLGAVVCAVAALLALLGLPRGLRRPDPAEQEAEDAQARGLEWSGGSVRLS
ncbi:MFS transporter [Rhodococcus aerolatus]